MEVEIMQATVLLLEAVYLMIKSSLHMLERKNLIFFLPVFFLGIVLCFQGSFFYFGELNATITAQNTLAVGVYAFYIIAFIQVVKNVK